MHFYLFIRNSKNDIPNLSFSIEFQTPIFYKLVDMLLASEILCVWNETDHPPPPVIPGFHSSMNGAIILLAIQVPLLRLTFCLSLSLTTIANPSLSHIESLFDLSPICPLYFYCNLFR